MPVTPQHTRKQSSLLTNTKNARIKSGVFCVVRCDPTRLAYRTTNNKVRFMSSNVSQQGLEWNTIENEILRWKGILSTYPYRLNALN